MTIVTLPKEINGIEKALIDNPLDFSGTYMAVCDLYDTMKANPDDIGLETIHALRKVLESEKHRSQTKSLFLYRQAAKCLAHIPIHSCSKTLSAKALLALKKIVATSGHTPHRAASEALGKLPVLIEGPYVQPKIPCKIPSVTWEDIVCICKIPRNSVCRMIGRSLITELDKDKRILVVKLSKTKKDSTLLQMEAAWMEYLTRTENMFSERFDIPVPIRIKGNHLFRIRSLPDHIHKAGYKKISYGIAFFADSDYFTYPNEHSMTQKVPPALFKNIISQNAWLLGNLASAGIIHTAPIPLFHNRVQRHRRTDHGLYEWPLGGRLDRWLSSTRYPNLGLTGIRDFEHMVSFSARDSNLYEYIGTHILSLVLVIGSYFRNKEPEMVGLDLKGNPIDVRYLFDPLFVHELLKTIFYSYYKGFTGSDFQGTLPFDPMLLSERLIDEMGIDRHMEEVLRAGDVTDMTDEDLKSYLFRRGYQKCDIAHIRKTNQDVRTNTGPHLGGFNQRISIPELITFLETVSALCISGKYSEHS